ncbi:MAG: GatB/YqeY domain-containing protein [Desulfuromonadales bacterium]|nr:GatB/YqeY domain-containing protein [Desulfuromonadales bacterium]
MSLKATLTTAMKEAMKARDAVRLGTVRMTLSAIKNKEIEAGRGLDDAAVTSIISTLVKQRREAAEAFRNGDRLELAAKEEAELIILQSFLPPQLSEEQVRELVDAVVAELGATSMKDMGRVMKVLTEKTLGQADGKLVSTLVKARLCS